MTMYLLEREFKGKMRLARFNLIGRLCCRPANYCKMTAIEIPGGPQQRRQGAHLGRPYPAGQERRIGAEGYQKETRTGVEGHKQRKSVPSLKGVN